MDENCLNRMVQNKAKIPEKHQQQENLIALK
jgi:hypothetical protein